MSYFPMTGKHVDASVMHLNWNYSFHDHGNIFRKLVPKASKAEIKKPSQNKEKDSNKEKDCDNLKKPKIKKSKSEPSVWATAKRDTIDASRGGRYNTQTDDNMIDSPYVEPTLSLPVPVLNTGTPLDGSAADIHAAMNVLIHRLKANVPHKIHRLLYQSIEDLRAAERNQAHIVQALAHQMAELSVELEEYRSGKKDRRSTDAIKTAVHVEAVQTRSPLQCLDRSFTIRSINSIMKEHPELTAELTVLRAGIEDQESKMSAALAKLEAETHGKVFEAFKKIAKLQRLLDDKNIFIRGCFESMDKFEIECDARLVEITGLKNNVNGLKNELTKTNYVLERTKSEHGKTVLGLQREKNALVEKVGILETSLATERLKVVNAGEVKQVATRYFEDVKESYDFYREFYDKQIALYDRFLVPRGVEKISSNSSENVVTAEEEEDESPVNDESDGCSTGGAVKNVSKALRAKYREQLELESESEPSTTGHLSKSMSKQSLRRVRGSDFLAMVHTRRASSAPVAHPLTPSDPSPITETEQESVQEEAGSGEYYDESSGEFVHGSAPECNF